MLPERAATLVRAAVRGARGFRHRRAAAFATVLLSVLAFTRGWPGQLVLDGPGVSMFVSLALDHLQQGGGVPYWMPELWAGTPAWALAPSFPTLILVPFAILIGADEAVQLATLVGQIVGGWGAFVLAQSLWGRKTLLPLTAAVVYALHPLFLSHGALFGHETSIWVMSATPWLAWAVRRTFRGDGTRYAVLAGLLAAAAMLQQGEHAYGLVVLGGCQTLVELGRARREGGGATRLVVRRAATVAGVGLGAAAFWLVPLLTMSRSFVLTPPATVRAVLLEGIGSFLGKEPATFLARAGALTGTVTFDGDLLTGNVYLGWVCLVPTMVTALLLARHDEDGHLTAVLVAGAIGVWLSTAGVPLADSGPAQRTELLPFLVIGAITGLLIGSLLRRLASGRAAVAWGMAAGMLLLILPYLTPFLALQRVVPLLSSVRFPRFYPVAALGLALGAVYPLRLLGVWAQDRRPLLAPALTTAAAMALVGAFLVDVHPYRSYYRARPPEADAAYAQAAANLRAVGTDFRVATPQFGDPRLVDSLRSTGYDLSVGWPHPIAGKQVWRLTGEAMISPPVYRDAALALSGTRYLASEEIERGPEGDRVRGIRLERNPHALPLVRAYQQAVVVRDSSIAPELAVSLAPRNISVVTGGSVEARALGGLSRGVDNAESACEDAAETEELGHEVAMACALHPWIGVFAGFDLLGIAGHLGAVFRSSDDGLAGIGVWLDRPPGLAELAIHEVGAGGALEREVARATSSASDWDDNGLFAFRFPPLADSAGKDYAFLLSCLRCAPNDEPRLIVSRAPRGPGNLADRGSVNRKKAVAFGLIYERLPAAGASDTTVNAVRTAPGRWRVDVTGDDPALVVVAEAHFPGWRATVDGRPAPVLQADGAFLGVPVGAGAHRIDLEYHVPAAATVGRLGTAGTLLGLVGVGLFNRRRTRDAQVRGRNAAAGLRGPNAAAGLRGPNAAAGLRGPNAGAGLRGPNAAAGLRAGPNPAPGLRGPNAAPSLRGHRSSAPRLRRRRGPNAAARLGRRRQ